MSNTPDLTKQLADLTKRNERLERIAKMSGAHKAHFDTLASEDADAFLAKSTAERDALVQKAVDDDKPIWTGDVTKVEVRKRDGALALQLAKANEENAVALAKREAEIEKAEIAKAATALFKSKAPGSDEAQQDIVRALRKSGLSADRMKAAEAVLVGLVSESRIGKSAAGFGGTDSHVSDADHVAKFNTELAEFAKSKGKTPAQAQGEFVRTQKGAELYAAANA